MMPSWEKLKMFWWHVCARVGLGEQCRMLCRERAEKVRYEQHPVINWSLFWMYRKACASCGCSSTGAGVGGDWSVFRRFSARSVLGQCSPRLLRREPEEKTTLMWTHSYHNVFINSANCTVSIQSPVRHKHKYFISCISNAVIGKASKTGWSDLAE